MSGWFQRKITQYIFFDLIPPLIIGLLVFIFILLMFQALRLTDFVLGHGVPLSSIGEMVGYLSIGFVPILLPMSLLFAVIMTYSRLSTDSEIVAMKACGLSMFSIGVPAFVLSCLIGVMSAQTFFHLAPWGNRQFELLVVQIGQTRPGLSIREGTFSEDFFNMVVYAKNVDSKSGTMKDIFIYDEARGETPLTIIAKNGQLINDPNSLGHSVMLRLSDGEIHRKTVNHTKIKFDTFDFQLLDPVQLERKEKTLLSMTIEEVEAKIKSSAPKSEDYYNALTEFHKRWALSFACPIFGLVGVGLATRAQRRTAKGGGFILSLGVVIAYYILYISMEGLSRSGQVPIAPAIWLPDFLFVIFAFWQLKKIWN